jgi:hypothetical protein
MNISATRSSEVIAVQMPQNLKGKGFPLQAWCGSWGSRRLRLLDLLDFRLYKGGKVVTLTHRPPSPPGIFLVLIFRGWVDPRAHDSAGSYGKDPQRHHWGSIPRPSEQCLNQYATPGPATKRRTVKFCVAIMYQQMQLKFDGMTYLEGKI